MENEGSYNAAILHYKENYKKNNLIQFKLVSLAIKLESKSSDIFDAADRLYKSIKGSLYLDYSL